MKKVWVAILICLATVLMTTIALAETMMVMVPANAATGEMMEEPLNLLLKYKIVTKQGSEYVLPETMASPVEGGRESTPVLKRMEFQEVQTYANLLLASGEDFIMVCWEDIFAKYEEYGNNLVIGPLAKKGIWGIYIGNPSGDFEKITTIEKLQALFGVSGQLDTDPSEPTAPTSATVGALKYNLSGSNATVTGPKSKSAQTLTIPATIKVEGKKYNVTAIEKGAFKSMSKLTKVTIGKNIEEIGKNAFNGCKKLKTIVIKTSKLKTVGSSAFKGTPTSATVKCPKAKLAEYQKLLVKKGISKKAAFKKN